MLLATACANAAAPDIRNLADLSLEDLANIRITSVSRKAESLAHAPASIFVITGDEIRRSGANSLPEAMRLAPNLQVAQVDARNYAITARGFNSVFQNKMLVLIDGRAVYSPLFSGVFWDAQDVVLEDIQRIEVISGPGATIWGANAVNGVINVITKSAADTQGGLVAGGASKFEKNGTVRYGGKTAGGGHYRVYGKYADADDTVTAAGASTRTGWRRTQTGFRTDWGQATDGVTVQGDAYDGNLHQAGTNDIRIAGANLLGRINRKLADGSDVRLQAYWDYTNRNQPGAFIENLHTFDLEAQHSLTLAKVHNVTYGGGYRYAIDDVQNTPAITFRPGSFNMHWANLFVQDEIDLSQKLRMTVGAKVEHNTYTGSEFLPTLRLAYKPSDHRLFWGAASRAIRTPSRFDRDLNVPGLSGGPNFNSEVAKVLELGYREQPLPTVSYSITVFTSEFEQLRTLEVNRAIPSLQFENGAAGKSRGLEMWGNWQVTPAWRLAGGFVTQNIEIAAKPGRTDLTGLLGLATNDPSHFWSLRSSYDIAPDKELDFTIRHVGQLPAPVVPAYTTADVRFGWRMQKNLELSVVGQNLFGPSHPEFAAAPGRSLVERSLFLKLLWKL